MPACWAVCWLCADRVPAMRCWRRTGVADGVSVVLGGALQACRPRAEQRADDVLTTCGRHADGVLTTCCRRPDGALTVPRSCISAGARAPRPRAGSMDLSTRAGAHRTFATTLPCHYASPCHRNTLRIAVVQWQSVGPNTSFSPLAPPCATPSCFDANFPRVRQHEQPRLD